MKRAVLFLCFLFLCTACSRPPTPPQILADSVPGLKMRRHIEELTADKLEGRRGGTAGEAGAALYLAHFMQEEGLTPQGDKGTYFQTFPIAGYEPVQVGQRMTLRSTSSAGASTSENLLGLLPGKEDDVIIVSAHYDHLGMIGGRLYPGANDNASGVAAVMELVNILRREQPPNSLLFAFWGAEEMGMLGSAYFCDHPTVPIERIKCIINLDSIGNLGNDKTLLGWKAGENEESKAVLEILAEEGWIVDWQDSGNHNSDHSPFGKKKISGFTLLAPQWLEKNHTPLDTAREIKWQPLEELIEALAKALRL